MRPYGFTKGDWKSENGGPTSKHRKLTSKNRRTSRRLLAKKARNVGIRTIRKEVNAAA